MKAKIIRKLARVHASRVLEEALKANPFYSSNNEVNDLVNSEIDKVTSSLTGSYSGLPKDHNEMIDELEKLEMIKAKTNAILNSGKLF